MTRTTARRNGRLGKALFVANTDWFLWHFNRELIQSAREQGFEPVAVSPPGEYAERLQQEMGVRWIELSIERRRVNCLRELRTLRQLWKIYRRERPVLVHHFTLKCALYGSIAARLAGVERIVSSITGLGYLYSSDDLKARVIRRLVAPLARLGLRHTDAIFLNRDDLREMVHDGCVDSARSHLIQSSGVDVERFQPSVEDTGAPVAALVGRLLWSKGVGEFVEVARRLRQRGIRGRFALIGDADQGNPDSIDDLQLEEWRREGAVELWGFTADMDSVYRSAALLCHPTLYREGVPTVLLEAGASGRALIATDMPGCREVVDDGVNGYLVPPRDVDALTGAVERLLEDAELRRTMGARARDLVVERFSTERVASETLDVYLSSQPPHVEQVRVARAAGEFGSSVG